MGSKPKVFVALTTTGMVLSLILPTKAIGLAASGFEEGIGAVAHPLSHRVDRLKAKVRNTSSESQGGIENIVQFFNFHNCSKGTWKNC